MERLFVPLRKLCDVSKVSKVK